MKYGIADVSIIPVRYERSFRSEMISQILFGELYEILEEEDKWLKIRMLHEETEGWINIDVFKDISEEFVNQYNQNPQLIINDVFSLVKKTGDWGTCLLIAGSVLPFFDAYKNEFKIGEETYKLENKLKEASVDSLGDILVQNAFLYFNAPYLWGGRTPYGIDCAALIQMIYKLANITLPRKIENQLKCGSTLSFLEETKIGDLAFFGDDAGVITHVGMLWESGRIIHASGKVRVDKIDHHGIFNEENKRYTHSLKLIKRIFEN